MYVARVRDLAAGDDPAAGDHAAGDAEIPWAIGHASPAVREVVRRWPARGPGRSRLDVLYPLLDAGLRT